MDRILAYAAAIGTGYQHQTGGDWHLVAFASVFFLLCAIANERA